MVKKNTTKSSKLKKEDKLVNIPDKKDSPIKTDTEKIGVLYFIENSVGGIDKFDLSLIKGLVKDVTEESLILIIHTYGGDVYSAVKIVNVLQNKFKNIKAVIPDFAYSSGTMMSLGSDEIYMNVDSTLGPLDLPMEHPIDGCDISSLDITDTLNNLASVCTQIAMGTYSQLRSEENGSNMRLGKKQASELSFKSANNLIKPIVNKIDPFTLQKGYREQKIGLYYAKDLLKSRMMKGNEMQALTTSKSLVNGYPSHGFGIFREELKNKLKLNIKNLESFDDWKKIEPTFEILKKQQFDIHYETI